MSVSNVNIREHLEKYTSSKVHTVWWAEVDGKVFISDGHSFFYRKSDLCRTLQNRFRYLVSGLVQNWIGFHGEEKFSQKDREKLFQKFWNGFVGETEEHRIRIRHYEIPLKLTNSDLIRLLKEDEQAES